MRVDKFQDCNVRSAKQIQMVDSLGMGCCQWQKGDIVRCQFVSAKRAPDIRLYIFIYFRFVLAISLILILVAIF